MSSTAPLAPGWLVGAITGCARGLLAGQRRALRTVLTSRFGPLPPHARARIAACDRLAELDDWLRRAATSDDIDEVWAGERPGPAELAA
ncbi:MAG: hypothetical protein R3F65_09730 [bacterium]|nr:hypothetical protein [Myxococcales bacterium]MCB9540865.1 hypothetical protein [Myxococcales bacterium]